MKVPVCKFEIYIEVNVASDVGFTNPHYKWFEPELHRVPVVIVRILTS